MVAGGKGVCTTSGLERPPGNDGFEVDKMGGLNALSAFKFPYAVIPDVRKSGHGWIHRSHSVCRLIGLLRLLAHIAMLSDEKRVSEHSRLQE